MATGFRIFYNQKIDFKEICKKADGWNQRVQRALDDGFVGVQSVDTLYQLLYEAEEEFNVRLETGTLDRIRLVGNFLKNKIKSEVIYQNFPILCFFFRNLPVTNG
jgi:hypothetical protein